MRGNEIAMSESYRCDAFTNVSFSQEEPAGWNLSRDKSGGLIPRRAAAQTAASINAAH